MRFVTDNLAYKVLSLLIALALWFIVRDERVETTVMFSLDVATQADLVVSNEALPEIAVGVAGSRGALDRMKRTSLVHLVRLKGVEPGLTALHVRPEEIEAPRGVEVLHVTPSTIPIRIETRSARRVAVHPRLVLDEDSPFRVKKVTVVPDRVRIDGPASIVASVEQVWTEAIPIPPRSGEAVSGVFALSLPHVQLRADAATVAVTVELEERAATPSPVATRAKAR
jgi:hypothetical protein